jgi:hypothetical protein
MDTIIEEYINLGYINSHNVEPRTTKYNLETKETIVKGTLRDKINKKT